MADKVVDVTELCNYDGCCLFGNEEEGYAFCYGGRFGTERCPLQCNKVLVSFKDGAKLKRWVTKDEEE